MDSLKISIIIPTYNRVAVLGATLDSVMSQNYQNWECLVIDDDSKDRTEELMEFYCNQSEKIKFFKKPRERRRGANASRNYGFELCKGDFINWFDSDDIMKENFLSLKIDRMITYKADCVISTYMPFTFSNGKQEFGSISPIGVDDILKNLCLNKYSIPTNSALWRRACLDSANLFNENLSISQDLEFYSRTLNDKHLKIEVVFEALFFLRLGGDSITSGFYNNIQEHFNSYLYVRKRILSIFGEDIRITKHFENELMGIFRYLLTIKDYSRASLILKILKQRAKIKSVKYKISLFRIYFMYRLIKFFGKGETKFKRYLYISGV